jgi:hypothetical protein
VEIGIGDWPYSRAAPVALTGTMSRPFTASVMGVVFILLYIAAAVTLPDVLPQAWPVQAVYFLIAGVIWVLPIRWLMLWSVHKR